MPLPLATGLFLILIGLIAFSFGLHALLRGGRGQRGGIGPLSERGIHAIAGLRMMVGGVVALFCGAIILWSYFSG